jgi:NitT/TauT family transport system substrate-binding protein
LKTKTLTLLTLLLVCAVSCREQKTSSMPAAQRDRVVVNVYPNITYAPLIIAKQKGYFAEENIDAVFQTTDTNAALLLLMSGKLDVAATPARTGIFNMVAKGTGVQIVADRGHSSPACVAEAIVAPPAMAESMKTEEGFRNARFASTRGGLMELLTEQLLARHRLTPADVHFVQLAQSSPTAQYPATAAVRFQSEPNLTQSVDKGIVKIIAPIEDLLPGSPHGVLMYGARLSQRDPELGRRFMRAYLRGVRAFREGKTAQNVEIVARLTKLPDDVVRKACWSEMDPDGTIQLDAFRTFYAWGRQHGYIETDIPESKWVNPTFAKQAAADLGAGSH